MTEFQQFSKAVHARFTALVAMGELYVSQVTGDDLWANYLEGFPADTNPIFRERTEHDCSCCRNFIKNLGRVVAISDAKILTVWEELGDLPYPYDIVASYLDSVIKGNHVEGVYRTTENSYGAEQTLEHLEDGQVRRWNHFHGMVPAFAFSKAADELRGTANSTIGVVFRGLQEITSEAIQTVIDLIDAKALYRGDEFAPAVRQFQTMSTAFQGMHPAEQRLFAQQCYKLPGARIRNTAIGTLLQELSSGMDLEDAVKRFEAMVAPTNYKRTTALITPLMIGNAVHKLEELGLASAIKRRFAKISDITINNVIWADGSAKAQMKGDLASLLMASPQVKTGAYMKPAVDISIEHFMDKVVPTAFEMSVLFKNGLINNLASLTAPVDESVGNLFQWDNNFGWSYNGNITDSITEKVKRAGGATEGKLRVSLAWFNPDDLDLHCVCPDGHVHYANKMGVLDVDMNAHGPKSATDPVENMNWANPADGKYRVYVNQFNKRTSDRPGFVLEVKNNGNLTQYSFAQQVSGNSVYLEFDLVNGVIQNLKTHPGLVGEGIKQDVWGLRTETFVKVSTLMFSPNYWDGNQKGNKHWFFMLDGCLNDQPTRGIYNEFLKPELQEHRKVFEVLGAQTMCPVVPDQLSGLGFSSTKREVVTVKVVSSTGSEVLYNVNF
uniref:DNA-directed RNA polymerase n=1 Tax=Pseudomonas phage Arace01 TaxID=3138526 RepID=A0AAU6VZZ1_9VIRU